MTASPCVYIVVVNYNGWADTIECLESVLRSDYPAYRVIVCDNGSTDGSGDRIQAWAEGRLAVEATGPLAPLTAQPVPKPVPHGVLEVLHSPVNRGFAGGNNLALRAALARGDLEFAWLLNNDTVVEPDALSWLVERLRRDPRAGICGSTIRFYNDPSRVQAYGGDSYNKWFGIPRHIERVDGRMGEAEAYVEARMAFVMGTSMLVTRSFLQHVGLMCEDYFLFFEELDWATRGRDRFRLAYAPQSVVYHKSGRSTGLTSTEYNARSDYYMNRSQLLFARRHTPAALFSIFLRHLLVLGNSVFRGRWHRVSMLARIYADLARGRYAPGRAIAHG